MDARCLGYLLTFRTYGTWLQGDERGSVRYQHHDFGTPLLDPSVGLRRAHQDRLKHPSWLLDAAHRTVIEATIHDVARFKQWTLHAIGVRTNHVHVVVSAPVAPESVLNAFKAWSTRRLREAELVPREVQLWSRHGSTRYLWTPHSLRAASHYVAEGQGPNIPV